jgi:RNA polymerase sigma factor (sigma-70 family)
MTADTDEPDAALVARCLAGEAAAWAALVRRYQRLVYTVARRIGHDEHAAADVFQTVFGRLVAHLPRIADPSRLQAWIVTTAKREALLQRARSQRTVSMTRDADEDGGTEAWDAPDDALLPDEALAQLQQADRVRRALDRLDTRCRELLRLLFADADRTPAYDEVSRRLNMPPGSIGPTRARCLTKLRQLVE